MSTSDIGVWLRGLRLGEYETAFRKNAIDLVILPELTADDLREIGVTAVGHRRRILSAAAALQAAPPAEAPAAPAPAPGAERRQVTVLFCDLAGSTGLSTRLDPEDLRAVMAAYHQAVAAVIERHGGYLAKFLGDGVLAYFGWPRAGEDDAERALRAGLAAVQAVAGLEVATPAPLAARVGIATGEVVVGELLGEGAAQERAIIGETPNLAARLQGLADPGCVLACPTTRRLSGGLFAWEAMAPQTLKGFDAGVACFLVLGESGVENRFEALRLGARAPILGREEEIELLLLRWRRARAGEGRVVLLRGEPGIGKSRLTAALQEVLAAEEHEELVFFCSPQHSESALRPVAARLERSAGIAPGDAPAARLAKLEALLGQLAAPAEDVALVANLLGLPAVLPTLSPQDLRERLLRALLRRIEGLAARRPLLALVEDAHWIDPTTREFLDMLVAEAGGLPMLLIVTHRPEFDAGAWLGQPHVTALQLNRLGRAEHLALLRRVAGKALPPALEAELLARTDGVPLFAEEMTKAVLEAGLLREEAEAWVLDGALPQLAVPATLQATLAARLDRLSSVREVAQAGAVIGREFGHDLLAAVAEMPEAALQAALAQLEEAGLVHRRGAPPAATYTFKHALVQDAAYGTLLRERRRALHARVAAALRRLQPDLAQQQPEILARHLAEAGEAAEAARMWLRGGELAMGRSANVEASLHLQKGIDLLPALPETERPGLEARLQATLGSALLATLGYAAPRTAAAFERARVLLSPDASATDRTAVHNGLFVAWYFKGRFRDCLALGREFLAWAEAHGDATALCAAHRQVATSLNVIGDVLAAQVHAESARANYDEATMGPLAWRYQHDLGVGALYNLCIVSCHQGRLAFAAQCEAEALAAAERLGHANTLGYVLYFLGAYPAWLRRDAARIAHFAERLIAFGAERSLPQWSMLGACMMAHPLLEAGRAAEALESVRRGLALCREMANRAFVPCFRSIEAEALLVSGLPDQALAAVAEALAEAEETGEHATDAELLRLRGRIHLAEGREDAAREAFAAALAHAEAQGSRMFQLRAALELARLDGDAARLRPLLAGFAITERAPEIEAAAALVG